MAGKVIDEPSAAADHLHFVGELKRRRDLAYDYLNRWPGAGAFKPSDIHDALFSYVQHRGKGLRPALLMLSAAAVGGDEAQAIPAAAAVEIFHIWTLVHDDIIDRDDMRRGNPTVHAQYSRRASTTYGLAGDEAAHYGAAVGILCGDVQQSWSYALMCDLIDRGVAAETVLTLVRRMATDLTPRLLEGEMLDVQYALTSPDDLSEDQILHMLSGKSAALLQYAAWAGATIGLQGQADPGDYAEQLGRFALLSGLAFQLQDDILGLTANETDLGKPVGSDLREGKRTLILLRALAAASRDERAFLISVTGRANAGEADLLRAIDIIRATGVIADVWTLANSYISQARNVLATLPDTEARQLLNQLSTFMLARTY